MKRIRPIAYCLISLAFVIPGAGMSLTRHSCPVDGTRLALFDTEPRCKTAPGSHTESSCCETSGERQGQDMVKAKAVDSCRSGNDVPCCKNERICLGDWDEYNTPAREHISASGSTPAAVLPYRTDHYGRSGHLAEKRAHSPPLILFHGEILILNSTFLI